MIRLRNLLAVLFSLSLLVPAFGQDPAKEKEKDNPVPQGTDVVITASRLEEPTKDVASSITSIPAADVKNAQHRMVTDALREVPGLDTVQAGTRGGNTSVFLRGAASAQTLVLIDGIEANDPIDANRGFNFANLTADNIERIEVLRGPQSVLYGSDAMGGVINVITHRGSGDPHASFTLEGGSFSTYRGSVGISGGSNTVNYSFGASRTQSQGISAADVRLGNHEKDGYRNETFSGRIGVTPLPYFDIDFVARAMQGHAEIDNGGGAGQDDPNHTFDSSQYLFRVAPRLKLLDGTWEQTLGFSLTNSKFDDNNPLDPLNGPNFTFSTFSSQLVALDWQHNFYVHPTQTLTIGLSFEEESGQDSGTGGSAFGPFSFDFGPEKAWTRSAYAQYRVHLWERLTVTAGARVDDHKEFGTHGTYRGTGAYILEETATKFHATIGTGFKSPTLFELFDPTFGVPTLKPEESTGWDAGVDQTLIDGHLTASVTYFRNNFTDLIDFDGSRGPAGQYVNVGRARTDGVEVGLRTDVSKDLVLRLTYTFTDTEDKDTKEALLRRPRHKAGFRADYDVTPGIHLNTSVLYVGKRTDSDFSTFPASTVTLGDYILWNLGAAWRISDQIEVFARGENLTDKKYQEVFGFGTTGAAGYVGGTLSF